MDNEQHDLLGSWRPRKDQWDLWHYLMSGGHRAVEVAHRRWGKDDVALHFTACAMARRVGNYWHMLPKYEQARKVVWTAINPRTGKRRIDEAFPVAARVKTREQDMAIEYANGSTWQLVGSDNYDSLVGSPPVGIVLSEWALANPMAWAYLSPILEENGGWALFIYTSRGNNHGLKMYNHAATTPGWFGQLLGADKTPCFTREQLKTIEAEYVRVFGIDLGQTLYNQEYMCSFEGASIGAYYARQISEARRSNRITNVPWTPSVEVDTAWDLGVDDSMSIGFFQRVGQETRIIDYYEGTGYGLEHYAKALKERPYVYGNHYMPHDADIREMSSGEVARSRKEVAESLGIRPVIVVPRAHNIDTIMQVHIPAVRNLLPSCWIDQSKCEALINCLESYQAEYNEEKKKVGNRPLHNWASHGADMMRTYAVGYKPPTMVKQSVLDALNRPLQGAWGR